MSKSMAAIGTIYMALLDSNKQIVGGFFEVGIAYPFSMQVASTQKSQKSRKKETAGQLMDTITRLDGATGSLTLKQWDPETLAMALSGKVVEMTAIGGTVSSQAVTLIEGAWVRLPHRNVENVTFATGVEGVDYEVREAVGLVKLLKTDVLTAGATSAAYSYAAESGYKVEIGTETKTRVAVLIDGRNEADDSPFDGEFYSVVLASGSEVNFITAPDSDYEDLTFTLTFETPEGKTSPGIVNGLNL